MYNRSKYKAKKTEIDGIVFDSKKEANRYLELKEMQNRGEIHELQRQVKFQLIPAQKEKYERYSVTGKRLTDGTRTVERPCYYLADFVYIKDGEQIVEDTKGFRTSDYRIKRKLMLYVHHIKIQEI